LNTDSGAASTRGGADVDAAAGGATNGVAVSNGAAEAWIPAAESTVAMAPLGATSSATATAISQPLSIQISRVSNTPAAWSLAINHVDSSVVSTLWPWSSDIRLLPSASISLRKRYSPVTSAPCTSAHDARTRKATLAGTASTRTDATANDSSAAAASAAGELMIAAGTTLRPSGSGPVPIMASTPTRFADHHANSDGAWRAAARHVPIAMNSTGVGMRSVVRGSRRMSAARRGIITNDPIAAPRNIAPITAARADRDVAHGSRCCEASGSEAAAAASAAIPAANMATVITRNASAAANASICTD